eukprot:1426665-Amphidinium_carterae.1
MILPAQHTEKDSTLEMEYHRLTYGTIHDLLICWLCRLLSMCKDLRGKCMNQRMHAERFVPSATSLWRMGITTPFAESHSMARRPKRHK